jgi:hypothetical protein
MLHSRKSQALQTVGVIQEERERSNMKAQCRWVWLVMMMQLAIPRLHAAVPQEAVTLTNQDVTEMVAAGISEDVVTAKIKAAKTVNFDTSTAGLKALKEAKVPDGIVQAMIQKESAPAGVSGTVTTGATAGGATPAANPNDPLTPHEDAMHVMENGKMTPLEASRITQDKNTGMGAMMVTGGLSGMKQKAEIQRPHSGVVVSSASPVFYFYIENDAPTGMMASMMQAPPKSADDFLLTKMEVKKETREVTVMQMKGSGTKGANELLFTATQVGKGIYRVTPDKPLTPGEYCFFQAPSNPQMPMPPTHMYTFQIAGNK